MKKSLFIVSILFLVGGLVACNSFAAQGSAPTGSSNANGMPAGPAQAGQASNETQTSSLPVDSIVGIGILKLEGTDQAIDAAKAKELLPLFKALKVLSGENNTAVAEISALNKQIKNTLSADQLTAIEKLNITSSDLKTLMDTYGISSSTSSSSSSSSSGEMGGPGGPGGDMMMVMSGGKSSSSSTTTKSTPNAAAALTISRKSAGGLNLTFVEPIIKLLESKVTN